MSRIHDVMQELESIGAIGDKVVLFRPEPLRMVPEAAPEPQEEAPEPSLEVESPVPASEGAEAERARWTALAVLVETKLAALMADLQEFQAVFLEMREADQQLRAALQQQVGEQEDHSEGEVHASIQEET